MRSLNRQRATLVFHHLQKGHVPTPQEVSAQERIFERDGVLRAKDDRILGHCTVGVPMKRLLAAISTAEQHASTKSLKISDERLLSQMLDLHNDAPYIMWHDASSPRRIIVVLKKGATARETLVAWWQALLLVQSDTRAGSAEEMKAWMSTRDEAKELFDKYQEQLTAKGWDLDTAALETTAGARVVLEA